MQDPMCHQYKPFYQLYAVMGSSHEDMPAATMVDAIGNAASEHVARMFAEAYLAKSGNTRLRGVLVVQLPANASTFFCRKRFIEQMQMRKDGADWVLSETVPHLQKAIEELEKLKAKELNT